MELLSAYADGELSDSDKAQVEEHLIACENCSALLELYREISVAAKESSLPVPEALRAGVMEKVLKADIPRTADNVTRLSRYRVVLTRYAPIAACLAVILLALPFVVDNNRQLNDYGAPSAPAPAMTPAAHDDAAPVPVIEEAHESQHSLNEDSGEMHRMNEPEGAAGAYVDADDGTPETNRGLGETTAQEAGSAPAPDSPLASEHDQNPVRPAPPAESPAEHAPAPASTPAPAPAAPADMITPEHPMISQDVPERTEQESDRIMDFMSGAYAWITVTGEIPRYLAGREPMSFGPWMGWEMVFEIPRSAIPEILDEQNDRNTVNLTSNHNDSSYAVVMYSK